MNPLRTKRRFPGALASVLLCAGLAKAQTASFSLAADFSYTQNQSNSTWSYRLDDGLSGRPTFPLLPSTQRDANGLWGSTFPNPPRMWAEATGYWGIGRNETGRELLSAVNGTRWAPGEVLFHPKAGASPSRLVVAWTAPRRLNVNVWYTLAPAAEQGNGIGYEILKRAGGVDQTVVALANIGAGLASHLQGVVLDAGDQLFFRFDTCGDPGGDITRAEIRVDGVVEAEAGSGGNSPYGGSVVVGSDFTLSAPDARGQRFQWRKGGQPVTGATNSTFSLRNIRLSDAGAYSVLVDSRPSPAASLSVQPETVRPERHRSPVPRQVFPVSRAAQEAALATNEQMLRFSASRRRLAADRYRPAYHFVSPESQLNDPNGLCYWQGRWHLFYQGYPPDEFPQAADIAKRRQHWGHAISDDLIHWRDLPYAIYPGIERMCFSGGTVVDGDRVIAYYPGIGAGQMVAISSDPLLLNWEKIGGKPVTGPSGDSCIWKEGDTFYGLVGDGLVSSKNLSEWTSLGSLLEENPFPLGDASACPNFVPIGSKHLFLSFSHTFGGQYLLGDYDARRHKFKPYAHDRFNHGRVSPGGVHAPSAASDGQGGVINILNINDGRPSEEWDQVMSLAQRLTLGPDSRLRIQPVDAIASLRGVHQYVGPTVLPASRDLVLDAIKGDTLELAAEIEPGLARWVQLNVLRSPDAEEYTSITFYNFDRKLSIWYDTKAVVCLDGTRSSVLRDVWLRPPERVELDSGSRDWNSAPLAGSPGRPLTLRVFVDRSIVEVFVNERHYLALRVYPGRSDSVGVSLRAQGQDAVLRKLDAWQINSIWP